MRPSARFLTALTLVAGCAVFAGSAAAFAPTSAGPTASAARTLTGVGGFTVTAPRGFKVRGAGGVYTMSNGKVTLVYARVRTASSAAATGGELAKATGGRVVRRSGGAASWWATMSIAKRTQRVSVRRSGRYLVITTARDAKGRGHSAAQTPVARAALTAAEFVVLQNIAATARGGTPTTLRDSLPLKQFTAPDGGSKALVPSGPGWQYFGGGGQIIAGNEKLGAISLGLPFLIQYPNAITKSPAYPVAPYQADARKARPAEFPALLPTQGQPRPQHSLGQGPARAVPGRARLPRDGQFGLWGDRAEHRRQAVPGPHLRLGRLRRQHLLLAGLHVVPHRAVGGDPRVFISLPKTWQSWDPSADQQRRLAQTLKTLASIDYTGTGGGIDPVVFSKAAAKWDAYIRDAKE